MNAELLKRLFRAIRDSADSDLVNLAAAIVQEERDKGHRVLVRQLEEILATDNNLRNRTSMGESRGLGTLPTSKRHQEPLATLVPSELLRHHMVLPMEVEKRFQRVEREYAARERLARYGLNPRKKVLLYGPPGCGKSLGAERLGWKAGLPLLKVRFDAIISSLFGESAANLRRVFEASKDSPCVLFLDECDFVARSRTESNDVGEVPRIVNTLLQLLEEYDAPGILVAATNLDQALDRALFRRFDDVFEVPLPGPQQVEELLRLTVSAIDTCADVRWPELVKVLKGTSAAQIVKVAQDAAKAAVLSNSLPVKHHHFVSAISEIRRTE